MSASSFTAVFLAVLAAARVAHVACLRQARHVARHRAEVPADFAELIPLEAHRKAADYTLEKLRFALVETWAIDGALLLLALTVGGGVAAI